MKLRHLSMFVVSLGIVGACWGCDDSSDAGGSVPEPKPVQNVCEDGTMQCSGDVLQKCKDNVWETDKTCEYGCDAEKKACKEKGGEDPVEQPVCTEDTCKDDHIRVVCAEDKKSTSEEECGENEKCDKGACVPAGTEKVCDEGDKKCDSAKGNNAYQECHNNAWEDKTCEGSKVCLNDECVDPMPDKCEDGQKKCSGTEGYVVCKDGEWGTEVTPCGEDKVCDESKNDCTEVVAPECQPNETKCSDDKGYLTCVDGAWSTEATPCGDNKVCDSATNTCEEPCTNGTKRCSADHKDVLACNDGKWGSMTTCKEGELCSGEACKKTVCTPGVDVCTGGRSKDAAMRHCLEDGQVGDMVQEGVYCEKGCTTDGTACLVCDENKTNCTDKGVFQICQKNQWVDKVDCGSKEQCTSKDAPYGCTCRTMEQSSTKYRCNADASKIMVCESVTEGKVTYRTWNEYRDCAGAGNCDDQSSKETICKCTKEEFSCYNNILQLCNKGVLTDEAVCTDRETCSADKMACLCKDGERICDNHTVKKCIGGKWIDDAECTRSEVCNEDLGSVCLNQNNGGVCKAGTSICMTTNLMTCQNGVYVLKEACSQYCKTGNTAECSDTCASLQTTCSADYKSIVNCRNNTTTLTECKAEERCVEKISSSRMRASCAVKVCDEQAVKCDDTKILTCLGNAWNTVTDCGKFGLACKEGVCVVK